MSKKIFFFVAILAAVTFTGCSSSSSGGNTPSDTVNKIFDAIKAGDYEKAVTFFHDDKITDAAELEKERAKAVKVMKSMYSSLKLDLSQTTFTVTGEEISEDGMSAAVTVDMTVVKEGKEPKTTSQKIEMQKVDGKWFARN